MLDNWIIEEIKRKEQEPEYEQIQIPLYEPIIEYYEEKPKKEDRGVVIIEL